MDQTKATEKVAELQEMLAQQVEALASGDDWRAMLEASSRFHHYSANNVMLILCQTDGRATRVAGYRAWQSMGRQVRKGEHGIRVLAPCKFSRKVTDVETGEETTYSGVRGFTTATVFDIAQTEGEPIPDVRPELLEGEAPAGLWHGLSAQVKAAGFDIARGDCHGGANGTTEWATRVVTVRDDVDEAQACKTLAHELAHVLLHEGEHFTCRGTKEVEAESVAFIVCQASGLVSDGYSFPYVARWADGDAKVVRSTAERVVRTARAILEALGADLEAVA